MRREVMGVVLAGVALSGCTHAAGGARVAAAGPDTTAMVSLARDLSSDAMRGRGPWTPENEVAARRLAMEIQRLGARPVFGTSLLVPFVVASHPGDTVYNVVGVFPARGGSVAGELVGLTSHLDHLGVGKPDERGDSIYNGFLDDALPTAMAIDVARRYVRAPGDRPLLLMFFNLEEQGLLGAEALVARPDAGPLLSRLKLLVGADAGSPAGEALVWQLMGGTPSHPGQRLADSLARAHGWITNSTPARGISDVYAFSQHGVPILFPIPGTTWKSYTAAQRADAMTRFDHYHQPSDEYNPSFPLTGTALFAQWLWEIVRGATNGKMAL